MAPRYKIVEELGKGGMGVVYRAKHVDLDREVALKLIPGDASTYSEVEIKRFHREVKVCSALAHPNIIQVYDSGEMDGRPFYTMQIVSGTDMAHLVEQGKTPLDQVLPLMVQACDALAYVHAQGMTHRDIKPANIMVGADGRVTVMDFGLAYVPAATVLTKEGAIVGTPRYWAPETVRGVEATGAADVYALALTTHELLLGGSWVPHKGMSLQDLAKALLTGPAPTLEGKLDVPKWLLETQRAALEKDPAKRATAAQYRDALKSRSSAGLPGVEAVPRRTGASAALRTTGRTAIPRVTSKIVVQPPPRDPRKVWAIAGAVALAAAGLGAYALRTPAGPPGPVASASAREAAAPRFQPATFPGHLKVAAVLTGVAPAGARVRLVGPDGAIEGKLDAGAEALFERAPAGADCTIRLEDAQGKLLAEPLPVRTPALLPVEGFIIYPSERDAMVVLDLPAKTGAVVEHGPWGTRAPAGRIELPAGQLAHRVVLEPLKPETDYCMRISGPSGWGGLGEVRFRTRKAEWQSTVRDQIDAHRSESVTGYAAVNFFDATPDRRGNEYLIGLLREGKLASGEMVKTAWIANWTCDATLTDLLITRAEGGGVAPDLRAWIVRAGGTVGNMRVVPMARELLAQSEEYGELQTGAGALARLLGREACPLIVAAIGRAAPRVELAAALARSDAACAREHALKWLATKGRPEASTAIRVLAHLGTDADLETLVPKLDSEDVITRQTVALAFCEQATPRVREALAAAFQRTPERLELIWAMAYHGVAAAAPKLAAILKDPKMTPEQRRAAACALGLVDAKAERAALRERLADADPALADACAWALGQLADAEAAPVLIAQVQARDARGAAAYALGRIGKSAADPVPALLKVLTDLEPIKTLPARTRLAVVTWALGQLRDERARSALTRMTQPGHYTALRVEAAAAVAALDGKADPAIREFPLLPLSPIHRTGIYLKPGESVFAGAREFTIADPGGRREGKPITLNATAFIGQNSAKLAPDPVPVVAYRAGEVVLRTWLVPYIDSGEIWTDSAAGLTVVQLVR